MPTLQIEDANGDKIHLSTPVGAGTQPDPLVQEKWIRNLGALLTALVDNDPLASPRTKVAAALQFFDGAALSMVRGSVANGLEVDIKRLPNIVADLTSDLIATAVGRQQVAAALQLFDSTLNSGAGGFLRARGTVANGLLTDVSRLPAAVQNALDAIRDRLPATVGAKLSAQSLSMVLASDHGAINTRMSLDYDHQPTWINKASNVDTSDIIDVAALGGKNELVFDLELPSNFVGTVTLTKSYNGGTSYLPLKPEPTVTDGLIASTVVLASNVVTINNPGVAVHLGFGFDSPPPRVKVDLDWQSGGSGTVGTYKGAYLSRAA